MAAKSGVAFYSAYLIPHSGRLSPECDLVAQSVEHLTFNQGVASSNLAGVTTGLLS